MSPLPSGAKNRKRLSASRLHLKIEIIKNKNNSRALKRLKKSASATALGDNPDNSGDDNDRSNTNNDSSRGEQEEDVGSSRSSPGRSGEVGLENAEHGGTTNNANSASRRHGTSVSSGTSGNYNNTSSRRKDRDSRVSSSPGSRSPSPSNSRSERRSSPPSSPTLFDILKVDWGKESWQDFELLQNNVAGPGTKGYGGPGASQGISGGKSECPRVLAKG